MVLVVLVALQVLVVLMVLAVVVVLLGGLLDRFGRLFSFMLTLCAPGCGCDHHELQPLEGEALDVRGLGAALDGQDIVPHRCGSKAVLESSPSAAWGIRRLNVSSRLPRHLCRALRCVRGPCRRSRHMSRSQEC